jgi:predicted DNA-binding transcriptional regulator YafY
MMKVSQLSQQAWAGQRVMRIRYRKPEDLEVSEREIDVYGSNGVYVDAYCRLRREPRTFRIDRILDARLLDALFEWDPKVEAFLRSRGWTGAVARPVRSATPQAEPAKSVASDREEGRGGLWQFFVNLLGMRKS